MPERRECQLYELNSNVPSVAIKAIRDYVQCKKLLAQHNPDDTETIEFLKRDIVRVAVVLYEAWYSVNTYFIEFEFVHKNKLNNVGERWINLDLTEKEEALIDESKQDSINRQKFRKSIQLLEKVLKIKKQKKFSFEKDQKWRSITTLFSKRQDFTHPKELENFDVSEVDGILPDVDLMNKHMLEISQVIVDVLNVIQFEHCKEKCSCGSWKKDGRKDKYEEAKKSLRETQYQD